MKRVLPAVLCIGMMAAGCRKKTQEGLPPATDWQASKASGSDDGQFAAGMASSDPHGDMESDPDPQAATDDDDLPAGPDMSDPHAGTDVTKLGLAAPDPDRPIDPSQRIAGVITIDARARGRAAPGTAVFLIVKRAGADGAPSGPPLAVDKLTWTKDSLAFELSDAQAMVAGTQLGGDVVVMARYDQDGDALTKQPGDITGQVRVKVPAENVKLSLDTVLP